MSDIGDDPLAPLRASPLWQAVFKLEWADEQFVAALGHFNQYVEAGGFGIRQELDEAGHRYVLFSKRLPKRLPILVGSGIHALRSALDTAVSTLFEGVTGKQSGRLAFPFHQTEAALRAEFSPRTTNCGKCDGVRTTKAKQREIMEHLPDLQEMIFNLFKPWEGGNYALWALNKLDNIQKHRTLLLALTTTSANFDYFTPEGVQSRFNSYSIYPGTEMVIASSRIQVIPTSEPNVACLPIFPKDGPFADQPLFETLGDLYKLVRSILITLHARFNGTPALR